MKLEVKVLILMMILPMLSAATDVRFQPFILSKASTLGELVEIVPENADWAALRLESHPRAGEFLEKDTLLNWISRKTGARDLRWLGKHTMRVYGDIHSKGHELAKLAKNGLLKELSSTDVSEVELQILNSVPDSEKEIHEFRADVLLRQPVPKRVCVWLKAEGEKHPVWFKIKTWSNVWVAKRRIPSHQPINADDFTLVSKEIAGLSDLPVAHLPAKQRLKHGLAQNEILLGKNIEPVPQIQKGQSINVLIKEQGLTIHVQALAEQDGHTGEMIKLKNSNSNKSFYARVTANQQAEISS